LAPEQEAEVVDVQPAYLALAASGELARRAEAALRHLEVCVLCARACRVNRLAGETGVCKTGRYARLSSYGPHLGEEDPLRGWRGSGTIFFARCNLHCQFCQNHDISQTDYGKPVSPQELAEIMLELQEMGCHNINLVSPSHVVAQILEALVIAASQGLRLPLVYNSGGYDSLTALRLLEGVIDIYMPDMKYADEENARLYSDVEHYPAVNRAALAEMHRQVGDLQVDDDGLARRGLLVRHLILPNGLAGTEAVVRFLAEEISKNTYLNLMDQYRPEYHAWQFPELRRGITAGEYHAALEAARRAGLQRLDRRRRLWD
jgi:putative pyruvate formate lyase activating enzyme